MCFWPVNNIPIFRDTPYRIKLYSGIVFRDVQSLPNPESNCPLLGMRALEAAGLKILIDLPARRFPSECPRCFASGFSLLPDPWSK